MTGNSISINRGGEGRVSMGLGFGSFTGASMCGLLEFVFMPTSDMGGAHNP